MNVDRLVERVIEIYDLQKNVVIVCGEGIVDEQGRGTRVGERVHRPGRQQDPLRRRRRFAADPDRADRRQLLHHANAATNRRERRFSPAKSGTPSAAAGPFISTASTARNSAGKPSICCCEGHVNAVGILQCNGDRGFYIDSACNANDFRDRWGLIHARQVHPSFYDADATAAVANGGRLPAADLHQRHWAWTTWKTFGNAVPRRAT